MNKAIVMGRLGADPEFKATSKSPVCRFTVATSEKFTKDGQQQERTEWHRVIAWGKLAEICNKYLAKGTHVLVEGKIKTREWEDNAGVKRYTTEINAMTVQFLDRKKADPGGLPL